MKGRVIMKEMLKSKTIIAFIMIVLGICFIGGTNSKLEESNQSIQEDYLSYNLK